MTAAWCKERGRQRSDHLRHGRPLRDGSVRARARGESNRHGEGRSRAVRRPGRRKRRSPSSGAQSGVHAPTSRPRRSPPCWRRPGYRGLAANFLLFVARKRRLFAVRQMVAAYRALVARHKGEVTAQVTVAQPLSDAHLSALKDALKAVTGRTFRSTSRSIRRSSAGSSSSSAAAWSIPRSAPSSIRSSSR